MDTDQKMKILKERARQFAGVKEEQLIGGETLSGLNILLSEETYILDSRYVVEVLPLTEFTPLHPLFRVLSMSGEGFFR